MRLTVDVLNLSQSAVAERKRIATLQAKAAMAGAELIQTKAGAFVLRHGIHSTHSQELDHVAVLVGRLAKRREATA